MIGTELGGYIIDAELGSGAMGTVYKARQISLDRPVAIKVLNPALCEDREFATRFRREAAIIAQLNHPHIVTIFSVGEHDGALYYAMELLDGNTVKDRLAAAGRFSQKESVRIIAHACAGVHAAHEHGIIHRDLKPENLAFDQRGRVKVMDFGIAHDQSAVDGALTKAGTVVGTPAFMSPEQASGGRAIPESDIYSLGVVFYEMLTGQLPFLNSDLLVLLQMQQWEEPAPLRSLVPKIPVPLEEIVLKMLSKAPAERYRSCAQVVADLRAVGKGVPDRSSARGTRSTGAVGMDMAGPAHIAEPIAHATDGYNELCEVYRQRLLEIARRERVTLRLKNGAQIKASAGHFSGGYAVLEIDTIGEIALPTNLLAHDAFTYGIDEREIATRTESWGDTFYDQWLASHDTSTNPEWLDEMLAAAKRELPSVPPIEHADVLQNLADAWSDLQRARESAQALTKPTHAPTGTALLGAAVLPSDELIMNTGKVVRCKIEEEKPNSLWVTRDDGRRVRVTPNDIRCVFRNIPDDDFMLPPDDVCADQITLRSGRALPCAILERGKDWLIVRKEDGQETRLRFSEISAAEWAVAHAAQPASPEQAQVDAAAEETAAAEHALSEAVRAVIARLSAR